MDLRKLIKDYLDEAIIMQIATVRGDQPWACTVHFSHDENFNLYWISKPERRHSEEIKDNPKVAGVIVLPHVVGQKVRGIQFQGVAQQLTEETDIRHALSFHMTKLGMPQERVEKIVANTDGHVVYTIKPDFIKLFDVVNFPDNPEQILQLS